MVKVRAILISAVLVSVVGEEWRVVPYKNQPVTNMTFHRISTRRLIGGLEAKHEQFKFMLFVFLDKMTCSGSLVKEDWVLLAAHCFPKEIKAESVYVIGGKSNIFEYALEKFMKTDDNSPLANQYGVKEETAKRLFVHPGFKPELLEHDIAFIQLNGRMHHKSISPLPISYQQMKIPMECTMLGWGLKTDVSTPFRLRYAPKKKVKESLTSCNWKERQFSLCVMGGSMDMCAGDSGSPLVCEDRIWGVCSHAITSANEDFSCGNTTQVIYSALYPELNWVNWVVNVSGVKASSWWCVLASLFGAWYFRLFLYT